MPLSAPAATAVRTGEGTGATAQLIVAGRENCIGVRLVNKNGTTPAHIIFTRGAGDQPNSVCQQVLNSQAVNNYLTSRVAGATIPDGAGAVAIGSSTGIYPAAPTPTDGGEEGEEAEAAGG